MAPTAGDVLLGYLTQQLAELRRHEPGVRDDDAESVHEMRVAARRLRSVLATGRNLFAGAGPQGIRSELRWFSEALGAARDPAVIHARLDELLASEPEELVLGPAARHIAEELDAAAAAGRRGALAALDSERYARLVAGLESLLGTDKLSQKASRRPRRAFRKFVAGNSARLLRAVEALPPGAGGNAPALDAGLHEVRKAAKRLRYSAELAATATGGSAAKRIRKTAKAARRIQTTLGLHHDTVMARALLADLGMRSRRSGENGFTYGRLHAREESLAARSEADFLKAWRKFHG
ncbi:CHAD domain-containing protein [Arthrobacter sp. UYCu712]|uniref:CHAD domain-containing protein n=1 Tax=Arthrobacter sp. UYCu712 TaxID=3156340 RepID=UPI00339542ED